MLLTSSHSPLRAPAVRRGALLALVSLFFVPQTPAFAQNGSYVKPTITVGEFFDDNLFMIPGVEPESDFVSRVSPGLEVGYRAPRGHLIGTYNFDAEIYPHHQALNEPFVRQNAAMDLQYQASQKVSFTTLGAYDRTHTPFDLVLSGAPGITPGLAIGRFEADQININPQMTVQMTGRTKSVLSYRWLRDGFGNQQAINPVGSDSFSSWMGDADARVEHQATGRMMIGARYGLRQFGFGNDTGGRSQRVLFGFGYKFSPLTNVEIWGGPRVDPGEIQSEITATLKHSFQRGQLTLNVGQTQGTTLGALVPLDIQTVNLQVSARTSRLVEIGFAPGFFRTTDQMSTVNVRVYEAATSLTLHLTPQLALNMVYDYTRQAGTFATFDQALRHQIVLVSFTVTPLRGVEF